MPTRIDPLFRQLIKKPRTKNERKPRICEHEEEHIINILEWLWQESKQAEYIAGWGYKITRYLNTKKPCAKCSKKK